MRTQARRSRVVHVEAPVPCGGGRGGNTTLDAQGAADIFLAKRRHKKRSATHAPPPETVEYAALALF